MARLTAISFEIILDEAIDWTLRRAAGDKAFRADTLSLFIAQGTEDKIWDAEMARRLVERLTHAGRAPEAHFFEGEGHVFQAGARDREWALLVEFFERNLAVHPRDTRDC